MASQCAEEGTGRVEEHPRAIQPLPNGQDAHPG